MPNPRARKLRSNLTDAEKRLWNRLRRKQVDGYRFRRQVPLGFYIVDFACLEARLVVEVDGGQHAVDAARDGVRDAWLVANGFRVLRFWNNDVLGNTDGVLAEIQRAFIEHRNRITPLPDPPPRGGRESV
ncbi:MAG: endonuclease domain-containing protein [Alphaproteobacteria bacterium]